MNALSVLVLAMMMGSGAADDRAAIEATLDAFHVAATAADEDAYFGRLADDAIFIGTDIHEHWTKEEFRSFCKPYFEKGVGWEYVPRDRTVMLHPGGEVAWFDELVDNEKYGVCRGTGVLTKADDGWFITQYSLSFPLPNDVSKPMTQIVKDVRAGDWKAVPEGRVTTVYLVRHAEKDTTPGERDPGLTAEGESRAKRLAAMLADVGLDATISSEYLRTFRTVAPASKAAALQVQKISARNPALTVDAIMTHHRGEQILVAGHSNTVPMVIKALGVKQPPALSEDDYDNLFIVTIDELGRASLQVLKY